MTKIVKSGLKLAYFHLQDHPTSPSGQMSDNESEAAGSQRFRGDRRRHIDPVTSSPGKIFVTGRGF